MEEGQVEVLGAMIDINSAPKRIVSPPSTALICIENITDTPANIELTSIRDGLEYCPSGIGDESALGVV